jgi:threonine dehydratase
MMAPIVQPPTLTDTLAARETMRMFGVRTPLYRQHELSERYHADIYVKFENHSQIRSFKLRGALHALSRLPMEHRMQGVVGSSTGNHGQGLAFAGQRLGVPVTIFVPAGIAELKLAAMRALGADVRIVGPTLSEAEAHAHDFARSSGAAFIEDGNNADLMAGAATLAWELLEEVSELDTIVVPVGGGNLIAAVSLVVKAVKPECEVIGVQAEAAPASTLSWRAHELVHAPCHTAAEGLATTYPAELAFGIYASRVNDMLLVSESRIEEGIADAIAVTGYVAEGATGAAFAALRHHAERWKHKTVAVIFTGGNLDADAVHQAASHLDGSAPASTPILKGPGDRP